MWAPNGAAPRVELPDSWPPGSMLALPQAVRERHGLDVRCVRHVPCDELIVVEVECDEPPRDGWAAADDDVAAAAWLSTRDAEDRAAWERPGWFAAASATFVDELAALGIAIQRAPAFIKGAWPCSAVLRAETTSGRYFFKAGSAKPPREPATLRALAAAGITQIPDVVATGPDDDWMITADFGSDHVRDHEGALRAFAELQLTVGDALAEQLPDFTPAGVAEQVFDTPGVSRAAGALSLSPVGAGLVLQDLRAGNVAANGTTFTFFDWTDVVRSHPFFSGIRYLDLFSQVDPACRWNELHDLGDAPPRFVELRDAYLAPFADAVGMDRARDDFAVAWSLQGAFMALRWDWEQSHLEHGAPWSRWLRTFAKNELRTRVPPRLGA